MDRISKAERALVRKIQQKTNADRIRAMSDEELAAWLDEITMLPINGLWLDWLKQEADI